jgi:RimJ/RimL family protein N-acetyltransferase
MIIELTGSDFNAMLEGIAPRNLRLVQDSAIAPPDVLAMLSRLATKIGTEFSPSAWMMVEDGEIVGLCSATRIPQGREIHIGYGVAPTRQGRGYAARAIGQLI